MHEDPAFRVVGPFKPRRKASPAYRASVVGCMVDIDDLVGAAEIAERLDHSGGTLIHDWQRRYPDSRHRSSSYSRAPSGRGPRSRRGLVLPSRRTCSHLGRRLVHR